MDDIRLPAFSCEIADDGVCVNCERTDDAYPCQAAIDLYVATGIGTLPISPAPSQEV